jgi:hypothetical protein
MAWRVSHSPSVDLFGHAAAALGGQACRIFHLLAGVEDDLNTDQISM